MKDLIIRKAHVVDPAGGLNQVLDLRVRNGVLEEMGPAVSAAGAEVFEAQGMHVFPGLIDLHTHFREPGFESKETIQTGSMAGLRGGFVASVSMPNTNPPCDHKSVIDNIIRKAREVPYYIFPAGTLSKGREGKELSEMADLKQGGGIVAVTDDGDWVADSLLMRRAMEYASMLDLIVMSHCEDARLSHGGVMNEGLASTRLGLGGIPAASEDVAVARDLELARLTGVRLHLCHLSSARSVELLRRAKADGIRVTAEVTPHNLVFSDEELEGYNTNFKMYPPLRTQDDIQALRAALKEGVIDCVSTDHAPHTPEEKMREFDHAPRGVIGLETALPALLTHLVHGAGWKLEEIVRAMSQRPAEILGLPRSFGRLERGAEANLTVVDTGRAWTVTVADLKSKSKNSCFLGRKFKGRVMATLCAGRWWDWGKDPHA
jgi:dihydroorotase